MANSDEKTARENLAKGCSTRLAATLSIRRFGPIKLLASVSPRQSGISGGVCKDLGKLQGLKSVLLL
jgi:hypothetical protein